jgi:hypothetical protein
MAIIGVELGADAYRFAFAVASVLVSLLLLWLAKRVLAGRGRTFTPEARAVVYGALLIYVGRLLPWAAVKVRSADVTLYGDSFDTQMVTVLAVVVYGAAVLSQIWNAGILRVALLAVALGAGAMGGMAAWQFLSSPQDQAIEALRTDGSEAFAEALRVPPDRAQAAAAALARHGSLDVSPQYGVYVVLAGGVLAAGGSLFSLAYGVGRALRRPRGRRFQGVLRPSDGPLGRRGVTQSPVTLPGTVHHHGARPGAAVHSFSPPPSAGVPSRPASSPGEATLPAPPPMPVGPGDSGPARPSLDARWAADAGGADRKRAGRRRR